MTSQPDLPFSAVPRPFRLAGFENLTFSPATLCFVPTLQAVGLIAETGLVFG